MDHLEYSQTPGARAKAWAKSNRDFTGLLLVISASPAVVASVPRSTYSSRVAAVPAGQVPGISAARTPGSR